MCSLITLTAAPVSTPSSSVLRLLKLARGIGYTACCSPLACRTARFHSPVRAFAAVVFRHHRTDLQLCLAFSSSGTLWPDDLASYTSDKRCLCVLAFLSAVLFCTSQRLQPSSGAVAALGGLWRSCLRSLGLGRGSEPSVALARASPAIVAGYCRLPFHTPNRSRSMSSRDSPNSQNSDSCRRSARNVATVSPGFCVRLWN